MRIRTTVALGVLGGWLCAAPAGAQEPAAESTVIRALRAPVAGPSAPPLAAGWAGQAAPQQPAPILPPAGSPPLLRSIRLEFPTQGNVSVIEPQTYL